MNEDVKIGKAIDELTFTREKKGVLVDGHIMLDFMDDQLQVHEMKKTKTMEQSHEMQVKFYIHTLRNKGYDLSRGEIHYPALKEKTQVIYTNEDQVFIDATLQLAKEIINKPSPPQKRPQKRFCKKCAFYELCYA